MRHTHTCRVCGHTWECFKPTEGRGCIVSLAAVVNRQGPLCLLCWSLIMAVRQADNRSGDVRQFLELAITTEREEQQKLKRNRKK